MLVVVSSLLVIVSSLRLLLRVRGRVGVSLVALVALVVARPSVLVRGFLCLCRCVVRRIHVREVVRRLLQMRMLVVTELLDAVHLCGDLLAVLLGQAAQLLRQVPRGLARDGVVVVHVLVLGQAFDPAAVEGLVALRGQLVPEQRKTSTSHTLYMRLVSLGTGGTIGSYLSDRLLLPALGVVAGRELISLPVSLSSSRSVSTSTCDREKFEVVRGRRPCVCVSVCVCVCPWPICSVSGLLCRDICGSRDRDSGKVTRQSTARQR